MTDTIFLDVVKAEMTPYLMRKLKVLLRDKMICFLSDTVIEEGIARALEIMAENSAAGDYSEDPFQMSMEKVIQRCYLGLVEHIESFL